VLTGSVAEVAPWLAGHADVNALDLSGVAAPALAAELEATAATTLTRVRRATDESEYEQTPDLTRMTGVLEVKTVWHPVGT
jgi:hypothetical protein